MYHALDRVMQKLLQTPSEVSVEDISQFSLWDLFTYGTQNYGSKPYITFGDNHTKWTYRQVHDRVTMLMKGLKKIGVKKNSKVALMLPNTPYYVLSFWATLGLGATVVQLNPLYAVKEIQFLINDSQADILITVDDEEIVEKVKNVLKETRHIKVVLCPVNPVQGVTTKVIPAMSFSQLFPKKIGALWHIAKERIRPSALKAPVQPSDIAVLQYTGGTTGMPKGAVLYHKHIMANIMQIIPEATSIGLELKKERFVAVLPFFHIMGLTAELLLGIMTGNEIILLPRFNLKQYCTILKECNPTILIGVPSIYNTLALSKEVRSINMSSVKIALCGGSSLSNSTKDFVLNYLGVKFLEGYGLSETSPLVCFNKSYDTPAGTVGMPILHTEVEIHDIQGEHSPIPKGEIGELWVRGPQVMACYWNKPEETALVLKENGWFRTGDMGRILENGALQLVDRIKDLIITNGYNVYPAHVESAINEHPAIAEVSVIGVKHGEHGEVPKAYVVLKEEQHLTEKELKTFLKEYLAIYQIPKEIVFLDSLPKTFLGKPSKKMLKDQIALN